MFDRETKDNLPLGPQQGKKADTDEKDPAVEGIQTIPSIFYGGADPNIYQEQAVPESDTHEVKPLVPPKKEHIKQPDPVPAAASHQTITKPPVRRKSKMSKKKMGFIFFVLLLFVGGAIFASWYYIWGNRLAATSPPTIQPRPVVATEPDDVQDEEPIVEDEPVEDVEIPVPVSTQDSLVLPRLIITSQADLDIDELTDAEEDFFGTDVGVWDSDDDGYFDGLEISNLYSPRGPAPARLIDSGVVREFVNATWQYRIYYPSQWVASAVDGQARQVLISAITGDHVTISVFDKEPQEAFTTWFGRVVDGQQFTDLEEKENRFAISYYVRRDGFVAYYDTDTQVYALVYHPGATNVPLYPRVMEMMVQSFRPRGIGTFLPEQQVLPSEVVTSVPPIVNDELDESTENIVEEDISDNEPLSTSTDPIDLDDLL